MPDSLTPPTHADKTPRRCDCAEYLRRMARCEANGSRDFGRGFAQAAAVLERRGR